MKEAAAFPRWTYQDYLRFPDDGKRREVVRGEKVVTPAPVPRHQLVCGNIQYALRKHIELHAQGKCISSPIDVVLDEDSVVQPDILFISRERLSILGERAITGAPDLVIEIRSPSTHRHDYVTKRKLYGDYGVREYWIVDCEVERVEVFVLEEGKLEKKAEVASGEVRSLVVLPELTVRLEEIFR